MLELLAPAGGMEALRAAVQNGADAVYLGLDRFSARASARNFSPKELREAVAYCHTRGVRVHLTLNTLLADRELPTAASLVEDAARSGVDAFIVQDLGVLRLCRTVAPEVPRHASTQMSLHSLEGVRIAAALGCERAVLARELPEKELAAVCRESPIEIEVFGHGALCLCYSGQCYFSAVVGRRSGDRGQCAQPCRLPYGYGRFERDRWPLSLKDNCLLSHLKALEGMGVASIKLEGRMKRPEYVAVVTRIYRAALDGREPETEDFQELERVFSRQGFTDGYFRDRTGREMFGVRGPEGNDQRLLAAARASYERGEVQRVPLRAALKVEAGEPLTLCVRDPEGREVQCAGAPPERARDRPVTEEALRERLCRTGGTPYFCEAVDLRLGPGLTVSAGQINALRREALFKLTGLRAAPPAVRIGRCPPVVPERGPAVPPVLTVQVRSWEQVTDALLEAGPALLYVPLCEIADRPERAWELPKEIALAAVLPRVVWERERGEVLRQLDLARRAGVLDVLTGNLGQLAWLVGRGLRARGDFGLNVFNSWTAEELRGLGLASLTASFELHLSQIRDLGKALPMELIAYGRLPLMLTENCLIRGRTGDCTCEREKTGLVDRTGASFPLLPDPGTCRTTVYNGRTLYLLDKRAETEGLGLWALRLCFTTEEAREVDGIVRAWREGGGFDPKKHSRGLYFRGVS